MGHSRPLFFYFRLFNTVNSKCSINFCRWLDSNCGPLELEATALPTASQPLPWKIIYWISSWSFRPNYILQRILNRRQLKNLRHLPWKGVLTMVNEPLDDPESRRESFRQSHTSPASLPCKSQPHNESSPWSRRSLKSKEQTLSINNK